MKSILWLIIYIIISIVVVYNAVTFWGKGLKVWSVIFLVLFLLLGIFVSYNISNYSKNKSNEEVIIEKICINKDTINISLEDSVYYWIESLNIQHPEVVIKQAKIESGNFTSKIYQENNNMFGMKKVYNRPTTQVDTKNGYGVYESWQMCVIDYALYQSWVLGKKVTKEEYINKLGKSYAEDPNYKSKIR